ncbi:MAG TPA: gamma-glutamyltransferase family protein [Thermotogota bacterium]|jgi:gamma-glutamyltranspeptidase/glutathione hydrolase|nr:gamma-glutamyltransferase family protein [Thermotogota bacterium]
MFPFDVTQNRRPKIQYPVFGSNGIVATSQYLAAQAGLRMLEQGGNAIDAAVATAIALTVVEPTSNGIGGDAFAIVLFEDQLYGLNSSGYAPASLSLEVLKREGLQEIPRYGPIPVTVPGAPRAWKELHSRFGVLPFDALFQPAIEYAQNGYPVSVLTGKGWEKAFQTYRQQPSTSLFGEWFRTFAPSGRAPFPGELWSSNAHARTLKELAETGTDSFYTGRLSREIVRCVRSFGGFLESSDLADYQAEWVEPLSVDFRGYTVWELPPNGQGIVALMALGFLEPFSLETLSEVQRTHLSIEAVKLAFKIATETIGEPRSMPKDARSYIKKAALEAGAKTLSLDSVSDTTASSLPGGTVYLCAADRSGNMVSYIQSNYMGFGSGLVVPGTGISLHNRGCNFSLQSGHPNCLRGKHRPYHTIIPGFLSRGREWIGPFGVMGGFMQPQGHTQLLIRLLVEKAHPMDALNAPRWQWLKDRTVAFEEPYDESIRKELARFGHYIDTVPTSALFGRGQVIWRSAKDSTGRYVFCGGTDGRSDGSVAVF